MGYYLCDEYDGRVDSKGRVEIPRELREGVSLSSRVKCSERAFYVTFDELGLDLTPEANLGEEERVRLADYRVELDDKNRVNLSKYIRYGKGEPVKILGRNNHLKILTMAEVQKSMRERAGILQEVMRRHIE